MGKHSTNIHSLSVIVNRRNQANSVSSNVKHGKFTNSVGGWEDVAKLGNVGKVAFLHSNVPMSERRFCLGIFLSKFVETFSSNYMHASMILALASAHNTSAVCSLDMFRVRAGSNLDLKYLGWRDPDATFGSSVQSRSFPRSPCDRGSPNRIQTSRPLANEPWLVQTVQAVQTVKPSGTR
jgi:hypothetical protein